MLSTYRAKSQSLQNKSNKADFKVWQFNSKATKCFFITKADFGKDWVCRIPSLQEKKQF